MDPRAVNRQSGDAFPEVSRSKGCSGTIIVSRNGLCNQSGRQSAKRTRRVQHDESTIGNKIASYVSSEVEETSVPSCISNRRHSEGMRRGTKKTR
jgi:hypothetical protein